GPDLDRFVRLASEGVGAAPAATMLTAGIARSYREGVERLHGHAGVQPLARRAAGGGPAPCQAGLAEATATALPAAPAELGAEVFGASALIVRCASAEDMAAVARSLEGQLTATLHLQAGTDDALVAELLPTLELKAGRILANGFPTGVEVCDAMVH